MTVEYYPEFITATILRWQHLLKNDNCKRIILESLQWLIKEGKCKVYAFVIMPNHIHLIWKISDGFTRKEVQAAFFSFTGHEFKKYLKANDPATLKQHYVNDADRVYQFWERDSLAKECFTEKFLMQKLEYLHKNPCASHWNLAVIPENYQWSSASFYLSGDDRFSWLSHIKE
jgi:REP element-mobilizing transposase RayT